MLSSKVWMCLAVSGIMLATAHHSMAQSSTRYSNAAMQRNRAQTIQRSLPAHAAQDQIAPPAPAQTRVAQAYVPQHLQGGIQTGVVNPAPASNGQPVARTAQVLSGPPIHDTLIGSGVIGPVVGSPVIGSPVIGSPVGGGHVIGGPVIASGSGVSTHTISGGCSTCPSGQCGHGFGGPVDLGVGQTYFDGGCGDACGGGCGIGTDCCGRGGCSAADLQNCWLNDIFGAFGGGEFFIGGTGFRSEQFQVPGSADVFDDSSFGFYGGFNVGMPLCRLSCGLISGQIGVRHISSNFDGNSFSDSSRNQTFFTAGLYRRVDYGLQIGVVADVLREDWFTTTQTVQLRGDFSWVYPSGSAFGFRFTRQLEDDVSDGTVDGFDFVNLTTDSIETYRFYYRHAAQWGGYLDLSAGWSDDDHWLIAIDHDVPVSETVSLQSNLTYLAGDDVAVSSPFSGSGNEAWNLSVGLAWRPRGRGWYRSYDTPLLPVADNGTFITRRGF